MKPMSPLNKLKVLIADDDKDDRYFIALAFKEAKLFHDIDFVKDGEELIEHLCRSSLDQLPDMILLDLNMPKKDGRVALKEIRSQLDLQNLNIVIFSTCISNEDRIYTESLGASRHVVKPFDFSELVNVIKDLCNSCMTAEIRSK